jgi:hypothetical protein
MDKNYNWWTDPKNKKEVDKISWWEHTENKTTIEIPVSIVNDGEYWCVGSNKDTEKLVGKSLSAISASGKTKEEAISEFFVMMKTIYFFEEDCRLKYQRWVPFIKGNWSKQGGTWFVIFGIHFYFRYGNGMKGGWYIPFTKLNISIHSDWTTYRNWKKKK